MKKDGKKKKKKKSRAHTDCLLLFVLHKSKNNWKALTSEKEYKYKYKMIGGYANNGLARMRRTTR